MKLKLPAENEVGFQMAPMIDITFLLIIFFMLVAKQTQTQFKKIETPIAVHSIVSKERGDRGVITIDKDGEVYMGAYPSDVERVKDMVKQRVELNPKFRVQLRIDAAVRHEEVRDVLKACAEGGAIDIIFSTYQSDK
jgi:biopolymer transport protein ExbD